MKNDLLHDIRGVLEYQQSTGLEEIPLKKRAPKAKQTSKDNGGELQVLREEIGDCTCCRLNEGRTNLVFGVGNPHADLMFIGEGPGRDEDKQGIPFVGRAGQLLTKIIEAMKLKRDDVYIANIVKCRPPQNRNPSPDEAATCLPYLIEQVNIIRPKVIVCLGSVAVQYLLNTEEKISRLRGNWREWNDIDVMPTYHPAFLLRNPNMKKPVWEDMQKVMQRLAV